MDLENKENLKVIPGVGGEVAETYLAGGLLGRCAAAFIAQPAVPRRME